MEPFRALVADMLPEEQTTSGFAVQSFFIGTGSVLASSLPYILHQFFGIANVIEKGQMIPTNVSLAFYIGAGVFISTILWTIFTTREYPPKEFKMHSGDETEQQHNEGLKEIIEDFKNMPKTMRQLGLAQFFTWIGLFALWIFTVPAVSRHIFHTTDVKSLAYSTAGDWVGVCFSMYNGVAALTAFLLPVLANQIGRQRTHALSLVAGGLGLASVFFVKDQNLLLLSMVGVGIAWASILSMPYAMLAGCIPAQKMGIYVGFFNFFIVLPQIMAAGILGFLVDNLFGKDSVYALLMGGIFMFLAAGLTLLVKEKNG